MNRWLRYGGVSSPWKYVLKWDKKNRKDVVNAGLTLDGLLLHNVWVMIGQTLEPPLFMELWVYNSYWIESMYVKLGSLTKVDLG